MAPPPLPATVGVGGKIRASWAAVVRTALSWAMKDAPIAHLRSSATQNVPDAAWTALSLADIVVDNASIVSAASSTINIGAHLGWWWVEGATCWGNSNAGTTRQASVFLDGVAIPGSIGKADPVNLALAVTPGVLVPAVDPGNTIFLAGLQDTGGTLATSASTTARSLLTAVYLRTL